MTKLHQAREMGIEVREAARGDATVAFLADEDGNQYEIQQSAAG